MAPCWFTMDPASLLVTSHYDHNEIPELPPAWLAHEYYEDDAHKMADVARSERGVSTLHEATGGDPSTSAALARRTCSPTAPTRSSSWRCGRGRGEAWGMLGLYRETGEPLFGDDELAFLAELAPSLAEGARLGLLVGEASDPDAPDAPGLVVLRDDWTVESLTPGVERWLAELPDGDWESETAALGGALGRRSRAPHGDGSRRARRGRRRARALALGHAGSCSTAPRSSPTARAASP